MENNLEMLDFIHFLGGIFVPSPRNGDSYITHFDVRLYIIEKL